MLPGILAIQEKQEELKATVQAYQRIQEQGLNLQEFKSLYSKYTDEKDPYIINLLKNVDNEFYEQNLANTSNGTYEEFLLEKNEYIINEKNSEEFKKRDERINTILPAYAGRRGIQNALSDYEFINYVEALLFTFNLETDDSIGIGNIQPVEEKSAINDEDSGVSTETSLFYIPLQMKLVWQKTDILDFIHYLAHAGSINIEDGEMVVHRDSVIKKPIEGDTYDFSYNIYENQLVDVEFIVMKSYIDTSISPTDTDTLENFVRKTQGRDRFEIELKVRFYVSGLPDYKVEEFIVWILDKYESLDKQITRTIAETKNTGRQVKSWDVLFAISTINSLNYLLDSLEDQVKNLRKTFLKDKTKIESIYEQALEINGKVEQVETIYGKNKKIIDTINK